ncbi:hypothetical protein GF352_05070 [archaeon]|nr:hypothetical protein [archaeon]
MEESKTYLLQETITQGESIVLNVDAPAQLKIYLEPDPESGWGYPDTMVSASITGPNNSTVLLIIDYEFSTYGGLLETGGEGYDALTRDFTASEPGNYTINVNSETEHIEGFYVKIEKLD